MRHPQTDSEVQRLLRPLSTNWVCAVVGVSRQAVADWRTGKNQPQEANWNRLLAAVREALPEADTKKEAPRPDWARGLATKADIDGMLDTLIPLMVDRVWQKSRTELVELLHAARALDNGDSTR